VPVVKQAEGRGFVGLATAIADLAGRARAKKLLPDEATGSTFTLTNSGSSARSLARRLSISRSRRFWLLEGCAKSPRW